MACRATATAITDVSSTASATRARHCATCCYRLPSPAHLPVLPTCAARFSTALRITKAKRQHQPPRRYPSGRLRMVYRKPHTIPCPRRVAGRANFLTCPPPRRAGRSFYMRPFYHDATAYLHAAQPARLLPTPPGSHTAARAKPPNALWFSVPLVLWATTSAPPFVHALPAGRYRTTYLPPPLHPLPSLPDALTPATATATHLKRPQGIALLAPCHARFISAGRGLGCRA